MSTARKTTVNIVYNGKNISQDIAPFLLSFEYTDNESKKADDIQIKLEDREGLWMKDWLPTKGDTITASIVAYDGYQTSTLPCGSFSVDEIEHSGPPHTVTIKAVSVPIGSAARGEIKTRAWEKISLKEISGDIASSANLTLLFESKTNPSYLRIDQAETSDLAFLQQLCDKDCLSLKVTDQQIVIFDERTYEANPTICEIKRDGGLVMRYSFKTKTSGTAKAAKVTYSDPLTGHTTTGQYEDPNSTSGATINKNEYTESWLDQYDENNGDVEDDGSQDNEEDVTDGE